MQKRKTAIFLFSFFIILGTAFIAYNYKVSKEHPKHLPFLGEGDHRVRDFSFISQDGDTITRETVKRKIYVVEYFFTTCKGICPKMNENISKVYQAFRGNNEVMILSHTVDPKKDTVAAMKEYSLRFDADPKQWLFLTGDKRALYNAARYSYLITAVEDTLAVDIASDFVHTENIVLVDKYGHLRGQYQGTNAASMQQLIGDIKKLLVEKE